MWPLLHRLVEPSPELRDPVDRLKARLITGILYFVSPVGMTAIVWSYLADATPAHSTNEVLVELVALALMGALIPWARGPRFRRAVIGSILIGQLLLCFVISTHIPEHNQEESMKVSDRSKMNTKTCKLHLCGTGRGNAYS